MSVRFKNAVWILPVALLAHELEEWNIKAWYELHFENPPVVPDSALRLTLIAVSLIGFLVVAASKLFRNERAGAHIVLFFFVALVFGNALQHIYWQAAMGSYAPGVVASLFLVLPATLWVTLLAMRENLVSRWYVAFVYAASLLSLAAAMSGGGRVSEPMQRAHELGFQLSKMIGL